MGFGNRLVIWSSGCPFTCEGCIVKELQDGTLGQNYDVKDLYINISQFLTKIDGITFSGGEPLYQSKELNYFLDLIPKEIDTMLFTGYNKDELNKDQLKCYNRFDLIVEGRFDIDKVGDFLWRGSSNQKIVTPTNKYKDIIKELHTKKSAGLEIKINNKKLLFYGIPTNQLEIEVIEKKLREKNIIISNQI